MELLDIERAIIKRYRNKLYGPFIQAIKEYNLVSDGDKIAICISGGKDSLLLAKLFQELKKHGKIKFQTEFIVMDPGFNKENITQLINNCDFLKIPIKIKQSKIFSIAGRNSNGKPCFICARMRRGFLYEFARENGCNKIALAHHFNDAIETVLLNILYGGIFRTMMPKLKAKNFPGMELIRPMILIREKDIIRYTNYTEINPMDCGCEVASGKISSKRKEIKDLIAEIVKNNKDVENNIYKSAENIYLDRVLGWKINNVEHNFLDNYDE